MLEVNNLVKTYTLKHEKGIEKIKALDGVSFSAEDGEILGFIGRSGGGKTTLMKILRGFEPFEEGNIILDGLEITPETSLEDLKKLRSLTAIHLQRNFGLWTGTAVENIIRRLYSLKVGYDDLPSRDESPYYDDLEKEAIKYLEIVGLGHKVHHLSFVMSGGEKQRVVLARQLAKKPKLLLLDEPATMTCPTTKQEVLDAILNAKKELNLTAIVVSHLPEIHAYLTDRLVWLDHGKIVDIGNPKDIIKKFKKTIPAPVPLSPPKTNNVNIKIENIYLRYYLVKSGEVLKMDNLSFDIREGEITSFIGPSGAGKSTLLEMIAGVLYPKRGRILYKHDGGWVDILTYSKERKEVRQKIGLMYQEFALSPLTPLKDQIAFRLGAKNQGVVEYARKKAEELGLTDIVLDTIFQIIDLKEEDAKKLFEKYRISPYLLSELFPKFPYTETLKYSEPIFKAMDLPLSALDAMSYQLSGGENVRAMLALALAPNPEFLLLDEPFGDLDPITLRDVTNSLKNINRDFGTTIVLVSHHVDFVKEVSHRAILVENGDIVMDGDPEEVCNEFIRRSKAPYLKSII
ncbi:MAG: ATP-binding cassette domain-containing protein [Methanosarcinales archaeon]